jgi:hypothetical protein
MIWENILTGSERIAVMGPIQKDKIPVSAREFIPTRSSDVTADCCYSKS